MDTYFAIIEGSVRKGIGIVSFDGFFCFYFVFVVRWPLDNELGRARNLKKWNSLF